MGLGSTWEGGEIPLNGNKGRFSTQILRLFYFRWFGNVLSLDKKEINVEMKKITLKRLQECLSVSTPSIQTTHQNQLQFNLNIPIFNVSLCSSISLECLEGVPCVLWAQLSPWMCWGNFGIGIQDVDQPHLCPAKCHLCKVALVGAGEGRNCLRNK